MATYKQQFAKLNPGADEMNLQNAFREAMEAAMQVYNRSAIAGDAKWALEQRVSLSYILDRTVHSSRERSHFMNFLPSNYVDARGNDRALGPVPTTSNR